jgi:hypothetical protein
MKENESMGKEKQTKKITPREFFEVTSPTVSKPI